MRRLALHFALALVLCMNMPVFGQAQRIDLLKARRAEKLKHLAPDHPGFMERFWLALEHSAGEKSLEGNMGSGSWIAPRAGILELGSGPAGGARMGLGLVKSYAAYSVQGYQDYEVMAGLRTIKRNFFLAPKIAEDPFHFSEMQPIKKAGAFAFADFRYRDLPKEDFYGLGPDAREETHSDYRLQEISLSGVEGMQWGDSARLSLRQGIYRPDLNAGKDQAFLDTQDGFNPASAPGLDVQPDFWNASASILLDGRDVPGNPHHGGAAGITVARFDDRNADRFEFNRLTVAGRYYQSLGSPTRVLAFNVLGVLTDTSGSHEVPFYMMPALGGMYTLRGFPDRRFRDRNLAHATAEYRVDTATWLELAFFTDAGTVFPRVSELTWRNFETSYGVGLRIKSASNVLFSVDAARSREGLQIVIRAGPSF